MKKIFSLLFFLMPLALLAQSVGQLRYDTVKVYKQGGQSVLKVEGAMQASVQGGANTSSFSAVSIGRSFTLGTISSDQTVTFPTLESGRSGTFMLVENVNGSAFIWNVAGPVIEAGTGTAITTIPIGLHFFWWNGSAWARLSTGSGSSPITDTLTFTSPLVQIGKNVSLDFDAFPYDTLWVEVTGDTAYNKLYSHTGTRDSTVAIGPASTSNAGIVTTGTQTLSGTKTFSADTTKFINGEFEVYPGGAISGHTINFNNTTGNGFIYLQDIQAPFIYSNYGINTTGKTSATRRALDGEGTVYWDSDSLHFVGGNTTTGYKKLLFSDESGGGTFTDPMTTNGDLITRSGGVAARLGIGTSGQVLTVSGGAPVWSSGNIVVAKQGVTGDTLLRASDDTLYQRLIRDSTGIEIGYAPDGAMYFLSTGGGGGTPGGSTTQVQFNDAGSFGGDAGMTYNKTNNALTVDTLNAQRVVVNNISGGLSNAALFSDTSSATVVIKNTGLSNSSNQLLFQLSNITGAPVTTGAIVSAVSASTGGSLAFQTRSTAGSLATKVLLSQAGDLQINQGGTFTGGSFSSTIHGSTTSSLVIPAYLYASTSGTAAAGFGSSLVFRIENASGTSTLNTSRIASVWRTATASSEDAEIVESTALNGTETELQRRGNDGVSTTDATVTTIVTIPIPTSDYREIDFSIRGVDGSNNVVMYRKMARVKNIAGTLTELGAEQSIGTDFEDAALSACDVTSTVSGTNYIIQVTGIAATNITWVVNFTNKKL